jgi:hypothetical protein
MWRQLAAVKGSPFQPPHRSFRRSLAIRARGFCFALLDGLPQHPAARSQDMQRLHSALL